MRKTKIICTLGPSTDKGDVLRDLIANGMNVARFNFSHGSYEEHGGRLAKLKALREELGKPVAALLDTKGVLEFASRSWNFVTPGTGHDAAWWRRFLETLRDCGYDGALSIEQEDYTIPLEEALQKAVSLLRQALPA